MYLLKILKDSVFPLFCFIVMQLLALIIAPYSKTYFCESVYIGENVISCLFTLFIYNFFVFSIYLLLFCVYFLKFHLSKMQIIKIAMIDFLWLIIVESAKTITYFIISENNMPLFFCIDIIYIVGVQLILIFILKKHLIKINSCHNNFNIILSILLLVLMIVGNVILYRLNIKITELEIYNNKEIKICIDSMIFKEYIFILFITVFFQLLCFMILLNIFQCEPSASRPVLSFITILFAFGICALKLIFPSGMICRINRFSDYSSKLNSEKFYIDHTAIAIFRKSDVGEYKAYYSECNQIYIGDKQICKFYSNYTYEKDDVEELEVDGYRFLVIKNLLVAYTDSKGYTGYILANGKISDENMIDSFDFNWIEKPYNML